MERIPSLIRPHTMLDALLKMANSSGTGYRALYQSSEVMSTGGFDLVFGKKPGNCGAEVGEIG